MKWLFTLIAIAFAVEGCNAPTPWGRYAIPFEEARARLMKADIIGFRNARQCGYLIHFALNTPDSRTVGWTITSASQLVAQFHIKLAATETGVEASFDIPAAPGGGEIYDGKQPYDYPMLMQPLRPALRELVDSAMEQRPYDWERIPRELLNVGPNNALSNCGNGRESLRRGHPWSLKDPPGIPPAEDRAGWPSE